MNPNPLVGVVFHWLGGFASASFYVPYRKVKVWPWEIFWLVGGVFSWLIAPWVFAFVKVPHLLQVLSQATPGMVGLCVMFGLLWGLGGLTYGLTMRYLGLGLGTAVALSLCALFGTIMPPLFDGTFWTEIVPTLHGQIVLGGLLLCLAGICIIGYGAHNKEGDLPAEARQSVIKEYNLKKGIWVAIFCGLMSSCFAYGLASGKPLQPVAIAAGTDPLFQGLPVLCIVLLGGATTNFIWCAYLIVKNRSFRQAKAPGVPHVINLIWCALAGVTWYLQFFFYTMGESQMGRYGFSSWTGFALKEWEGAKAKTLTLVMSGLSLLIASTIVIGFGNAMKG